MLGRKVIYVRCISCSYNNVAKGIRPLDKKSNSCLDRNIFVQVRAFERYIPLMQVESIAEWEHFAILSIYIKLPFLFKTFV